MEIFKKNICRTCMVEAHENQKLYFIYDTPTKKSTESIANLLLSMIPRLHIEIKDELPKDICRQCLNDLLRMTHFQEMCLQSQFKLLQLLGTVVTETRTPIDTALAEIVILPDPLRVETLLEAVDPLQNNESCIKEELDVEIKTEENNSDEVEKLKNKSLSTDNAVETDKNSYCNAPSKHPEAEDAAPIAGATQNMNSAALFDKREKLTDHNPQVVKKVHANHVRKTNTEPTLANTKKQTLSNDHTKDESRKDGETKTKSVAEEESKRLKPLVSNEDSSSKKIEDHEELHVPIETTPVCSIPSIKSPNIVNNTEELQALNANIPKKMHKKRAKKPLTDEKSHSSGKNSTNENSKKRKLSKDSPKHAKKQITDKDTDSTATKSKKKRNYSESRKHVCEYCKKGFPRQLALEIHTRIHTGEQPYLCSECGKSFTHPTTLQAHLNRHSGEMRYECPECPRKFPCPSDLYSHKKRHAKIKPHACDLCDFSFITRHQLMKHYKKHTGERPYKCEYCDKRFTVAGHMRRHERSHTGEKPYKCQYCTVAYAQSNDLIKHLRIHLGENVYRCELCPQRFRLAREVREHFPSHKNDDEAMRLNYLKALQEEDAKLKATLTMQGNDGR